MDLSKGIQDSFGQSQGLPRPKFTKNNDIIKKGTDFFSSRNALHGLTRSGDRREAPMNRVEKKEMASEAAKYFKEEVLELVPGIPRKELCDMVDDYIYYQTDDLSKKEAHAVVEATCLLNET
jgi:hypothetical protein